MQLSKHLVAHIKHIVITGKYFESKICKTINARSFNGANVSNISPGSSNKQLEARIGCSGKSYFQKNLATGNNSYYDRNAETM